jgi:hypothetical protein
MRPPSTAKCAGLLGMTTSTRSAGMAVIRVAAVAISPASACLVSALSVDSAMVQVSIGMVATFWASRESLPFSIAIFSGGLDVLGDNDLFVLMC